ncbi:MAG TPA: hypothetical protein VG898_08970 [Solirubrobacterales bacterium]|nr:hypothetical protein [Solirubrobacterales bacterium]
MTRDGKRPLTAIIAALIVAASLSACGGSDSDSSGSTAASTATTAQGGGQSNDGAGAKQKGQGKQAGQGHSQNDSSGSPPENVATPLKVSGGGSEQFRTKGGDNSIQEYGDESDESELQEVAEIVHGFFVARAEEKWETACSYLAKSNVEQLKQLASQSPQFKNASCGQVLKAFTRPLPASIQREVTTVDAGSFRHEGEQGFLIYRGAEDTVYAMPLHNEDGDWKVAALSGSALG